MQWNNKLKYLGVVFLSGLKMKCDTNYIMRKFYAASNCIFSNTSGLAELLQLQLQQTYCLPILQYSSCAIKFTQSQLSTLNVCWNDVFRKIFKFNRWESVTEFIGGLGYLNFIHLWYLSVVKFIKFLMSAANGVLRDICMVFVHGSEFVEVSHKLNVNCNMPMYLIRDRIYNQFNSSRVLQVLQVF